MDRTQQIKDAHPWLSYDQVVKVLLYHHQGSIWIKNLQRDKLERSMEAFTKLLKSKNMKALKPFIEYVLGVYYSGVDKYGNQIEVSKESFEKRWHKAREILLTSKNDYNITENPKKGVIGGISSGGICAFNAAWHRPDVFGNVISHCGSFTNIRGGDRYPQIVRQSKKKDIKVFLQGGENDLNLVVGLDDPAPITILKLFLFNSLLIFKILSFFIKKVVSV